MSPLCYRHHAPHLPARILVGLTLVFATLTVLRGWGYATAVRGESASPVVLISLGNLTAWGVAFMTAGLLVLAAYAIRNHLLVFLAHGLAVVTYAAVAVALLGGVVDVGSGWQHLAPMLGGAGWHTLLAWLTGPLPPSQTRGVAGADQ